MRTAARSGSRTVDHPLVLEFSEGRTLDFIISEIEFGVYGGRKIIVEYNTGPLMVYWKKE